MDDPVLAPLHPLLRTLKSRESVAVLANALKGRGAARLMDFTGAPRSLLVIATGVVILSAAANGRWPGPLKPTTVDACEAIAKLAGIRTTRDAWERVLKDAREVSLRTGEKPPEKVLDAQTKLIGAWQDKGLWHQIRDQLPRRRRTSARSPLSRKMARLPPDGHVYELR